MSLPRNSPVLIILSTITCHLLLIPGIKPCSSVRPAVQLIPLVPFIRLRRSGRCEWQLDIAQSQLGRYVHDHSCQPGSTDRHAGFYLLPPNHAPSAKPGAPLLLGPYVGRPACIIIQTQAGKGVCADAYVNNETVMVDDVESYPGHIGTWHDPLPSIKLSVVFPSPESKTGMDNRIISVHMGSSRYQSRYIIIPMSAADSLSLRRRHAIRDRCAPPNTHRDDRRA